MILAPRSTMFTGNGSIDSPKGPQDRNNTLLHTWDRGRAEMPRKLAACVRSAGAFWAGGVALEPRRGSMI